MEDQPLIVCAKFKKRGDYLWIMMNMAIVLWNSLIFCSLICLDFW